MPSSTRRQPRRVPGLAQQRLHNQHIGRATFRRAGDVVRWLGAVQAQDYLGSLWAIGLRMHGATQPVIERAIENKEIVRTWPLRGTLHFVAATDVRWMLELLTPRVLARHARRLKEQEDLDDSVYARSRKVLERALRGGRQRSRTALYQALNAARISTGGQRGLHILWRHAQEGLICFGPRSGKQQTFVLLDEWLPGRAKMKRDAALAELATRYFTSHGPATVQDFAWWSGLASSDALAALEMVQARLIADTLDGRKYWRASADPGTKQSSRTAHLLPVYDEYTVAYKDRSAALASEHAARPDSGHGIFHPPLVLNGRIVGTWSRTLKKESVIVTLKPFTPFGKEEHGAMTAATARYGQFLSLPVTD